MDTVKLQQEIIKRAHIWNLRRDDPVVHLKNGFQNDRIALAIDRVAVYYIGPYEFYLDLDKISHQVKGDADINSNMEKTRAHFKYIKPYKPNYKSKTYETCIFTDDSGNEVVINKEYLKFFGKNWDNLEFFYTGKNNPLLVEENGEIVSAIMPMRISKEEG